MPLPRDEPPEVAMRMPDRIDESFFAPCGIDCMACYAHLKKKKPCGGCLRGDEGKPERCKSCAIKACAREKGGTWCFECAEFPCARLKRLEKSYLQRYGTSLVENGRHAGEHGIASLLKLDVARWSCTACGGVVSLHDGTCSECGANAGA